MWKVGGLVGGKSRSRVVVCKVGSWRWEVGGGKQLGFKRAASVHSGTVVEGVTLCTELRGHLRLPLNLSNRDVGHNGLDQIGMHAWGPNSAFLSHFG